MVLFVVGGVVQYYSLLLRTVADAVVPLFVEFESPVVIKHFIWSR